MAFYMNIPTLAQKSYHRIIFNDRLKDSIPRLSHSTCRAIPRCIAEWLKTLGEEDRAGGDTFLIVRDDALFECVLRVVQWVKYRAYVPFLPDTHVELQISFQGKVKKYDPARHVNDKSHWAAGETDKYFKQELEVLELAAKIECPDLLDYTVRNLKHRYPVYVSQIVAILGKLNKMRTSKEQMLCLNASLAEFVRSRMIEYEEKLRESQAFLNLLRKIVPIKEQYDTFLPEVEPERFDAAVQELRKGLPAKVEAKALADYLMDHALVIAEKPTTPSPARDPRLQGRRVPNGEAPTIPSFSTPQSSSKMRPSPTRHEKPRVSGNRLDSIQPAVTPYDFLLPNPHTVPDDIGPRSDSKLAVAKAIKESRIIVFERDGTGNWLDDQYDERPKDPHDRDVFRYRAGEMLELIPPKEGFGVPQREIRVRNGRGEVALLGIKPEYERVEDVLKHAFADRHELAELKSRIRGTGFR